MLFHRSLTAAALVVALVTTTTSASFAQSQADKTTARNLSIEAQKALVDGDFETAADKFRRAEELFHAPTLLLGLARAYKGLGRYVESLEAYNRVIKEPLGASPSRAFKNAVEDAKSEVDEVEGKLAWVVITIDGPAEPVVRIDGVGVPVASLGVKRAVNPGSHELTVDSEGWASTSKRFDVGSGDVEDITLTLEEDPDAPPPPAPDPGGDGTKEIDGTLATLGWVGVGLGGAGLVLGAVTGGLAIGKHGELTDGCDAASACDPNLQGTIDDYELMGALSTVGFIAGGVLAAAGAALLIVDATGDEGDSVTLRIGPTGASARVRF